MYRNPLYPLKTLSFQLLDPEKKYWKISIGQRITIEKSDKKVDK